MRAAHDSLEKMRQIFHLVLPRQVASRVTWQCEIIPKYTGESLPTARIIRSYDWSQVGGDRTVELPCMWRGVAIATWSVGGSA